MKTDPLGSWLSGTLRNDLLTFQDLFLRWNARINLASSGGRDEFWSRHVLDSLQVFHVKQDWSGHYLDLGTGGGLPGIPVALAIRDKGISARISFIESDTRKAAFLKTACRVLDLDICIETKRIETLRPMQADILTARALAPLEKLLSYLELHRKKDGTALLPKGKNWVQEVEEARQKFSFDFVAHPSHTNADSRILEIGRVERA